MAELEPGACIMVLCVVYLLLGLVTLDTTLWLGGLVGLALLKHWTTRGEEPAVNKIQDNPNTDTSNTHLMKINPSCDIVTINSDLMASNKVVDPMRRNINLD